MRDVSRDVILYKLTLKDIGTELGINEWVFRRLRKVALLLPVQQLCNCGILTWGDVDHFHLPPDMTAATVPPVIDEERVKKLPLMNTRPPRVFNALADMAIPPDISAEETRNVMRTYNSVQANYGPPHAPTPSSNRWV